MQWRTLNVWAEICDFEVPKTFLAPLGVRNEELMDQNTLQVRGRRRYLAVTFYLGIANYGGGDTF